MTIHRIDALLDVRERYFEDHTEWPFLQVGVFPTEDLAEDAQDFEWFNYTVGLGPHELHLPCVSIEGRALGNELAGAALNLFGLCVVEGLVSPGDSVLVPLGVPNSFGEWDYDADAVFWLSDKVVPARSLGVNMTEAQWALPIRWSSPLGWPDDE